MELMEAVESSRRTGKESTQGKVGDEEGQVDNLREKAGIIGNR